jgi:hypothetical protein
MSSYLPLRARRPSGATMPSSSSNAQSYELLPRTSTSSDDGEFKDKPLPRPPSRWGRNIRKLRRGIGRFCKPLYISLAFLIFLLWQILFNGSYLDSHARKFEINPKGESVYIAANIIDGDLITGAWGRSLLQLVDLIGKERVFVSIYGGPASALKQLRGILECNSALVSEEEHPLDLNMIPRTTLPTGEERIKRIAYLAEVRNKVLEPLEKMNGEGRVFDKLLFVNDVFFEAEGAARLLWGTVPPPQSSNGKRDGNRGGGEGQGEVGKKRGYKAVCAADFVTSWKYYDTFATRDSEGYSIGVPIFPWFGAQGSAVSRKDVLAGKEAVRVKSCWGGMVAFDGGYFQSSTSTATMFEYGFDGGRREGLDLRFRSESEPFWDSSECCLIHADIIASSPSSSSTTGDEHDTGIYMNPYVRTAYSAGAFKYIWLAKRFERLFGPFQGILNGFAKLPRWNYRRGEVEGEVVGDRLWVSNHGHQSEEQAIAEAEEEEDVNEVGGMGGQWQGGGRDLGGVGVREGEGGIGRRATLGKVKGKEYWRNEGYYVDFNRTAKRGGYCGVRQLLVLKEGNKEGGNWDNLLDQVPPFDL